MFYLLVAVSYPFATFDTRPFLRQAISSIPPAFRSPAVSKYFQLVSLYQILRYFFYFSSSAFPHYLKACHTVLRSFFDGTSPMDDWVRRMVLGLSKPTSNFGPRCDKRPRLGIIVHGLTTCPGAPF